VLNPQAETRQKIRVIIVDDSALVRQTLSKILESDRSIEVVAVASDPYAAREKIKKFNPDVLTLDVEMPKMDGIQFLSKLMRLRPMPVVMVSSLTEQGAEVTLDALELGAVDFVSKPKVDLAHSLEDYTAEIISKVKGAAVTRPRVNNSKQGRYSDRRASIQLLKIEEKLSADAVIKRSVKPSHFKTTDRIVAIGASTGGTEAIKNVLMDLPADSPGIVIAQHIPPVFSTSFANRMDTISPMIVCEAGDGQQILPGCVYIAPGDRHLMLVRDGARYVCKLSDGPPVNRHRPSVDVLFRSVAQNAGTNAIGVLLTGMGDDGARGLKEIREAGAPTLVQDEKTSVVWGMPGEAVKQNAADAIVPLQHVANKILELTNANKNNQTG
jgi:two-component system, chemotaxis family, protein-glutamate methylesterase/glutaminase